MPGTLITVEILRYIKFISVLLLCFDRRGRRCFMFHEHSVYHYTSGTYQILGNIIYGNISHVANGRKVFDMSLKALITEDYN